MTEQEIIIQGNKLIDAFMESDGRYTDKGYLTMCKYHTSWDHLMEVVEKIEQPSTFNANVSISKNTVMVSVEDGKILFHGNIIFDDNKLKTVYLAVIAFINWFNEIRTRN